MIARSLVSKFIDDSIWNHRLTDAQLLEQAQGLAEHAVLMDPYTLSDLYDRIADLPGGKAIADGVIDAWVADFRGKTN